MAKASELLHLLNMLHESDQLLKEVFSECRKIIGDRMRMQTRKVIEQNKLTPYEAAVFQQNLVSQECAIQSNRLQRAEMSVDQHRKSALMKEGWRPSQGRKVPEAIESKILRRDRVFKATQDIGRYQKLFDEPQT